MMIAPAAFRDPVAARVAAAARLQQVSTSGAIERARAEVKEQEQAEAAEAEARARRRFAICWCMLWAA